MRSGLGLLVAGPLLLAGMSACGGGGSTKSCCGLHDDLSAVLQADPTVVDDPRGAVDKLVQAAPGEINDDVQTVGDAFNGYLDALAAAAAASAAPTREPPTGFKQAMPLLP